MNCRVPVGPTANPRRQPSQNCSPGGSKCSHSEISVSDGTEGGTAEGIQAVDKDQRAGQVLPPLGDGVPHLVQAEVELLDHVSVAVPDVGGPRQEEVVGRLPHALKGWDRG